MANSSYSFSNSLPPTAQSNAEGPFLIAPVTTGSPNYTTPLQIYAGSVCAPNTSKASPGITSTQNAVFTLSYVQGSYTGAQFFALVQVAAASVYSQDRTVRAQMLVAFKKFRQQVEALEVTAATAASGGLMPGGAAVLLNRVALSLPLRINEVLTYLYGLDPSAQYVDLQGGTSLRIEWAGYQYCAGPSGVGFGLNAFANTGTSRLRIAQRSDLTLTMEAFLGALQPGYAIAPAASCPILAAGPLDLCSSGNARRHLRAILPGTISGPQSLDNSGAQQQLSAWIVGADTYADLDAATEDILNGGTGCGKQAPGNNPIVSISFASRVAVIPEINVLVNNYPVTVPLGTSIRNLVAEYATPAANQYRTSSAIASDLNLSMSRWLQNTGAPIDAPSNKYYQANFIFLPSNSSAPPIYSGIAGDQYDSPVIKGDSINIS